MDKIIRELISLFDSQVKNISRENDTTIIEFENGQVIPIYGEQISINSSIPVCSFCNLPGDSESPLFTVNEENYICKDCTILSLETFLKNGIDIDFKLDGNFKEVEKQIKNFNENMHKVGEVKKDPNLT